MSTKRTPIRRNARARLSAETVALWVRLRDIREAGADEEWEPKGRRREYLDGTRALRRTLDIKPWQVDPLDAVTQEPPPYMLHNPLALEGWRNAWEWRQALEAAT